MAKLVHRILLLFLLGLAVLSCSGKKEENLQLDLISDELRLIDATSCKCGSACDSPDLTSQIIKSNTFNLRWKAKERFLEIQSIRVELTGGDLPAEYKYVFTDDELFSMFGTSILTFAPSPSGDGTELNTNFSNNCAFKVGGIPIGEDEAGVLSGKIVFKGFTAATLAGEDAQSFLYEKDVTVTYP